MELLYKYQNGNVLVTLYNDGTKIQEWDDNEKPQPIFPNSLDLKITNYCDTGCRFCHEMSTIEGKHGDLELIKKVLINLPNGTELAIGGGNPLDHPNLIDFLEFCKDLSIVPNITVNSKHLIKYSSILNTLLNEKLIYGLGLSIEDSFNFNLLEILDNTENLVFHVISGVNNISIIDKIKNSNLNSPKILILGYKEVGRGINYKNDIVDNCKKEWFEKLPNYIGKIHLSFDNLAINQLKINRFFNKKSWDNFFMGTDGQFTMYLDAVKKEFATSSTSLLKIPINGNIDYLFKQVRKINNF